MDYPCRLLWRVTADQSIENSVVLFTHSVTLTFSQYQDFKLLGVELQLPKDPHITDPLRSKTVFVIELAADTEASIRCSINPNKPHRCTLTYGDKVTRYNSYDMIS